MQVQIEIHIPVQLQVKFSHASICHLICHCEWPENLRPANVPVSYDMAPNRISMNRGHSKTDIPLHIPSPKIPAQFLTECVISPNVSLSDSSGTMTSHFGIKLFA